MIATTQALEAEGRNEDKMEINLHCDECGCNFCHPENSNFFLVAGVSAIVLAFFLNSLMGLGVILTAVIALWKRDTSEIMTFYDLAEFDLGLFAEQGLIAGVWANKNEMERDVLDVVEDIRSMRNIEFDESGNAYCPKCAEQQGVV